MAQESIRDGYAEWFKRVRAASGESQTVVARALGISVNSVRAWENGTYLPTFEMAVRIREHFAPVLRQENLVDLRQTYEDWVMRVHLNALRVNVLV